MQEQRNVRVYWKRSTQLHIVHSGLQFYTFPAWLALRYASLLVGSWMSFALRRMPSLTSRFQPSLLESPYPPYPPYPPAAYPPPKISTKRLVLCPPLSPRTFLRSAGERRPAGAGAAPRVCFFARAENKITVTHCVTQNWNFLRFRQINSGFNPLGHNLVQTQQQDLRTKGPK